MSVFHVPTNLTQSVMNQIKLNTFFINTFDRKMLEQVIHLVFQGPVKEWWLLVFGVVKTTMRFMQNTNVTSDDLSVFANLIVMSVGNEFRNVAKYKEKMNQIKSIRDCSIDILHQIHQNTEHQKWLNVAQQSVEKELKRTASIEFYYKK
jgi:hypothetical protein